MPERRDLRELEAALAALGDRGVRYLDRRGPAMYQTEPSWATAIVCTGCQYIALVPKLPRVLKLRWRCSRCGRLYILEPPAEVLAAVPPSGMMVAR